MKDIKISKDYVKQKRKHRIWKRIVTGLACAVVFSTTYMLILPALTMEQTTYCGLEEHTHDESCYEKQLICGLEETVPAESDATKPKVTEPTEEEPEVTEPELSEETEEESEQESAEPEETEQADNEEDNTEEESEQREPVEEVSELEEPVIVEPVEEEPEPSEPESSVQEQPAGHVHTDDCYATVLICQKEEHEHTLECFSDPSADVETQEEWEKTMADVELTGVLSDDVPAIAKSQIGYTESSKNYKVTEEGQEKGWSRYGAWYGDAYGDWDAMFAVFCLHYAEADTVDMPVSENCSEWVDMLSRDEIQLYHKADSDYVPVAGDLIFFHTEMNDTESDENRKSDHVGIVYELEYDDQGELSKIRTIEGDSDDKVQFVSYGMDDDTILGYGELPEKSEDITDNIVTVEALPAESVSVERENVTSVTITKKWRGAASARPASVKIHLYQNETAYKEIILSDENSWTYTLENIPYQDESGNAYNYTVTEDSIEGFYTTYSDVNVIYDTTAGMHYVEADTLETGKSYIMVSQGYSISVVTDKNGNNPKASGESVAISDTEITYDGVTYPSEITDDVPDDARWTIAKNDDGTYTFKCGNYYLFRKEDGSPYVAVTANDSKKDTNKFNIDEDGHIFFRDKDGKKNIYLEVETDKNGFKNLKKTEKESEASSFAFYEAVEVVGTYPKYTYTVTNAYISSGDSGEEITVNGNKYIDYLGDGGSNPDTELTGDEFYRQYLDMNMQGDATGVDFLFVVDTTGSMTDSFGTDPDTGEKIKRDQAVSRILNGSDSSAMEKGLLTQVLRANPENKAAVVTFCGQIRKNDITYNEALAAGEAQTQLEWTRLNDSKGVAPYANVRHTTGYGTCYAMGVMRAADMMQSAAIKDDGNRKVVVFLGDGEPNAIITGPDGNGGGRDDAATIEELADRNNIFFNWKPSSAAYNTRPTVDYLIESTKDMLAAGQEHVDVYSISVGYDRTGDSDILGYMADKGGGKKFVVNSPSETITAFREIISNYCVSGAKITDHISQYAELYKDKPDLKVTRVKVSDGSKTVVWAGESVNGNGSIGTAQNGGESYIQSVSYVAGDADDSTGTVEVKFQPNYILEPGIKYIVSYNLKVTDSAKKLYENKKTYGMTGDAGTDYSGNTTSSGKEGYYSNKSAILSYIKNGGENASQYPHPVIQVTTKEPEPTTTTLTVKKTVLGSATDQKFAFKAILSAGNFPEPDENAGYELDETGSASFSLGNEESITLTIPTDVTVTLTETSHDGYYTIIKNGQITLSSEETADITIGSNPVTIDVINSAGVELPATGGAGTNLFTFGGLCLTAGTLMYGYNARRRRGKGVK